jgi:hypothetical protein
VSQSGLGQPLRVVIPVMLTSGETLNEGCLRLVADNASGVPQIVTGRVRLEQAATKPRLVISTAAPVSEPAIRLAVQAGCGSTSRRDYMLLLDPPALESPATTASADAEEAPWIVVARERSNAERASSRSSVHPVAVVNHESTSLPRLSTWGSPVATGSVTPAVAPSRSIEAKVPAPVAASAPTMPPAPRELVTLVASSGAFIPEAVAAPLPARASTTATLRQTTPQSIPLITRPQPETSSLPVIWQQTWQFVALAIGILVFGFGAIVLRGRLFPASSWFAREDRLPLKGETLAGQTFMTMVGFEEMKEPATIKQGPARREPAQQTVGTDELDTLLHDIQSDMIDEKAVKDAWRAAATEAAADIGTDSILQAIAAAERDLEIGAPPGVLHTTMDAALERDLTVPNEPKKRG